MESSVLWMVFPTIDTSHTRAAQLLHTATLRRRIFKTHLTCTAVGSMAISNPFAKVGDFGHNHPLERRLKVQLSAGLSQITSAASSSSDDDDLFSYVVTIFAYRFEIIELRAMRDREARIPCGNHKIQLDGAGAFVIWLKNDKEIKYRYPNPDYEVGWVNPENIYETSCDPGLCRDPTNLIIKKVTNEDEGLYRCRVHYTSKQVADHLIELKVVRDTETEVYWRRNGAVTESNIFTTYNRVQAELVLENLTRQDDKMHLECLVQTADVSEAIVRPLVIRLILPPLSVHIMLDGNNKFAVGVPRVVECLVSGSFPAPIVGWFLGDSLLTPTDFKVYDGNTTSSTLTLTTTLNDDGKVLTCRAHNMLIPVQMFEDRTNITVGFSPECETKRVVTVGIVNNEIETVTCTVSASPEPVQFVWTFADGRSVITTGTALSNIKFSTNLTWLPSDSDFGVLECRATNSFGIQRNPCLFNLVPGGPPEPPKCDISRSVASQLDVNCRLGWDGGRPQTLVFKLVDETGNTLRHIKDSVQYHKLQYLPEEMNFTATYYSTSSRGDKEKEKKEVSDLSDPGWLPFVEVVSGMLLIAVAVVVVGLGTQICFVRREEESEPDLVPRHSECFHREPDIEMENMSLGLMNTPVCSPVVHTSRVFIGGPSSPAEEETLEEETEFVGDQDDDSQQSFFV
ncbi:hypothetical protein SFRURICE_010980 [Spodoptera frugiperda]|nr:hypothetical protein SFRURICE_010980 [Spodoptera frugiperda]